MDLLEARGRIEQNNRHPWETARLEVVRRLIDRHLELAAGSVVIDVGCGDAFVTSSLAATCPSVRFYGIDSGLTPEFAASLTSHYSLPNLHLGASLEDVSIEPTRTVALVLLMDVIEHVEDDQAFIGGLRTATGADSETCWLITVPAFQALFSAHDVFLRHYRRYSRKALVGSMERAGLRVVESGYFFSSLLPIRLLQVIRERMIGRPAGTGAGALRYDGPAAALLARVLECDAMISLGLSRAGIPFPGLALCAVCRSA